MPFLLIPQFICIMNTLSYAYISEGTHLTDNKLLKNFDPLDCFCGIIKSVISCCRMKFKYKFSCKILLEKIWSNHAIANNNHPNIDCLRTLCMWHFSSSADFDRTSMVQMIPSVLNLTQGERLSNIQNDNFYEMSNGFRQWGWLYTVCYTDMFNWEWRLFRALLIRDPWNVIS